MSWIIKRSDVLVALTLIFILPRYSEATAVYLYDCDGSGVCSSMRWLISFVATLSVIYVAAKFVHRLIQGGDSSSSRRP